jgi:hypothetical protein
LWFFQLVFPNYPHCFSFPFSFQISFQTPSWLNYWGCKHFENCERTFDWKRPSWISPHQFDFLHGSKFLFSILHFSNFVLFDDDFVEIHQLWTIWFVVEFWNVWVQLQFKLQVEIWKFDLCYFFFFNWFSDLILLCWFVEKLCLNVIHMCLVEVGFESESSTSPLFATPLLKIASVCSFSHSQSSTFSFVSFLFVLVFFVWFCDVRMEIRK